MISKTEMIKHISSIAIKRLPSSFLATIFILGSCQPPSTSIPTPIFERYKTENPCDPEIVRNDVTDEWLIYYTARQITDNTFLRTPIGVATSKDLINWDFKGYCAFDGNDNQTIASSTYWAPAIIGHEDELHMFVTWKPDTIPNPGAWGSTGGRIVQYKAKKKDPLNWVKVDQVHHDSLATIDATVYKEADQYHVWFKGKPRYEKGKNELHHVVSQDMKSWQKAGFSKSDVFNKEVTGEGFEEAPFIFQWKGKYWLITDPHKGFMVYESEDAESWKLNNWILDKPGEKETDNSLARHCSVAILNDRAFIFYHTEPKRQYGNDAPRIFKQPLENRISTLQMRELEIVDGKLVCNRDEEITL